MEKKFFIVGGCVSRDGFELDHAPEFVEYRARTSIVSGLSTLAPPIPESELLNNPSPFQRRMVATDVFRQLPELLREKEFDYLLIDFIVERLPLGKVGRELVTITDEFKRCGLMPFVDEIVDNSGEWYFEQFEKAWLKLSKLVDESRIIVNRVYWAQKRKDGTIFPGPAYVDQQNSRLDRLYRIIERTTPQVKWLTYDPKLFAADPDHKWGLSAFHFGPEFYEFQIDQLQQISTSTTPSDYYLSRTSLFNGQQLLTRETPLELDYIEPKNDFELIIESTAAGNVTSRSALVSFNIFREDGEVIPDHISLPFSRSSDPDINWFLYLGLHAEDNLWIRKIKLPEGYYCSGVRIFRWGVKKSDILVQRVSLL